MTKPNGQARLVAWRQASPAALVSSYTGQGVDGATLCWACRLRGLAELAIACNVETHSPHCGPCWSQYAEERERAELVQVDAAELARALEGDSKKASRRQTRRRVGKVDNK